MASFGKVLDLLDDRYLELQDVVGNVEPLPTLVPYKEYTQSVLVYSMDTNLNIYMALMQEFTERRAREIGKELWTWCVQWEVEAAPSKQTVALPPSPKKPRLDAQQLEVPSKAETEQSQEPVLNRIERRVLNPALLLQDDMLRCLIDIVQVESRLVPNFIEFLYRWIDFYAGDGKALKAAMRWEIPSLWEFEYHPLVLPEGLKQTTHDTDREDIEPAVRAGTEKREKPDIAALEDEVELSERLQYREVHYGIKPPKMNHPIPRLVNIPRDPRRRIKYYAACFKSRQRAFNMLLEAGLTVQQISNYKRQQVLPARETPRDGEGEGLRNYEKDARAAQAHYIEKEREMAVRTKHMEVAISNRLAFEAGVAARSNVTADPTGVPLIPATPSYTPRPAMEIDMLEKLQIGRGHGGDRINIVPKPLVGRLKSKLFAGANDMEWFNRLAVAGGILRQSSSLSEDVGREESGSSDDDSDKEEIDLPLRPWERPGPYSPVLQLPSAPTASLNPPNLRSVPTSSLDTAWPQLPSLPAVSGTPRHFATRPLDAIQALTDTYTIPQSAANGDPWTPQQIENFVDSLTPAQRHRVVQMMRESHATVPTNASPLSMDAPAVAGSIMSSASTSAQPAPGPIHASWSAVTAYTHQPAAPFLPQPMPFPSSPQASMGQSPFQPPPGFGRQVTTTLPMRPPMPTSYSDLAPGASQPPPQRRVSSGPASLSYLLTLGSGGPMQRNNAQSPGGSRQQQHTLAPRPSLPELPRLSFQPPTPRLPLPSSAPVWTQHPHNTAPNFQHATLPMPNPWDITQPPPQTLTRPFHPSPPRTGISRPSQPPTLAVPANPLSDLAPDRDPPQIQTSPFASTHDDMSIIIYIPKAIRPGNTLGPGGVALGDKGVRETDAVLLGHSIPGSGKIVLSRAIFLPMGIWQNVCRRAQTKGWKILESYSAGLTYTGTSIPGSEKAVASHSAVYTKLKQIYSIMSTSRNRESELTKRWRATRGPMTLVDRGSVWEGWSVTLDKGIEMDAQEREGATFFSGMIDEGVEQKSVDEETARYRKEIDRLLAEYEERVTDEDEEMES